MRNRAIVHFLRLVAFILVFGGVSSRAEAAWPKTGDVLVVTRSFDPATATSYPYLVAVDPVTQDKTVIADLSLLADPEIFHAGQPVVPIAVAESRDGIIWIAYRNSFAVYSSPATCTQCGGVVLRLNPDGTHSIVRLGWDLFPTGLASAPDGSVVMVTGPFGDSTGPNANHQLYRIRAIDALNSAVEGFQVPSAVTNPSCKAPITIAYLGQDALGNVTPPGQPGERYAFLDSSRNPLQAAIDAGITEVTDATGAPIPIQTYIDATGQPAAYIDSTGYVVIGDICDYDVTVFASAKSVVVDQSTGTDIYVGDVLAGVFKRAGDTVPFCQQFGEPGCGGVQHVVVADPATLTASVPTLTSDFGDPGKGTPIGAEVGAGVAMLGNQLLVTDAEWWIYHDLQNSVSDPCQTSPQPVQCNVMGALFLVNADGTHSLLSGFGYATAYGGAQGQSGSTLSHPQIPVVVTMDGTILMGACDGSNGLNSADSICQVDGPTSATPGFRTLWTDFGGMLGGRQLLGVLAMAVAPPTNLRTPTTTTLVSSLNPSTYGQAVTFTATVTGSGGTPTGQVTFFDGAASLGTSALDASGTATLPIDTLIFGSHSITASYGGDSAFAKSASLAVTQGINKATTTTTLSSSLNPAPVGTAITITASVAPQYGGQPTGTVTFREGTTTLQTVALGPVGAAITLNALPAGLHALTATYDGNANFLSSASETLNQIVGDAADVSITIASAPASPAIGTNVTFTLDVRNNGPHAVDGVVVNFGRSGNLAIVSATSGSFDPLTDLWTVGPLAAGAGSELQVVATLTDYAAAVRAEITSASLPDPDLGNNVAVVVLQPAGVIYVDDVCTLRQAIVAANTDAPFGGCHAGAPGLDVIVLPIASSQLYADVYEAAPDSNGDDALPAVTSPIRIEGRGAAVGRATGTGVLDMRVFFVKKGGQLTLHEVSVRNGQVSGPGAGILLEGKGASLVLDAAGVIGNTARGWGGGGIASRGAISADDGDITIRNSSLIAQNSADGYGGGILAGGQLTIDQSNVGAGTFSAASYSGNSASLGAGGIYIGSAGVTTITATGISSNTARSAGGIENDGTLHMSGSTVANNTATGTGSIGGGLVTSVSGSSDVTGTFIFANSAAGEAGAIWNGRMTTLTDTYVTGNFAPSGSGIENTGVMTILRGSVSGNTFRAGTTPGTGGGILNLLFNNVGNAAQLVMQETIMQANASGSGGAIATYGPATLTSLAIGGTNSTQGNVAAKAGGGILVSAGGQPGASGIAASPLLMMTGGTVSQNVAHGSFSTDGGGGGIANGSGAGGGGDVTLVDVTVSDNSAPDTGEGGGIFNRGTLTVTRGTMSGNSAGSGGSGSGGAIGNGSGSFSGGAVTLNQATISSNTAAAYGGAVSSRGTLVVNGGSIGANSAQNGGAIANRHEGTATLTGVSLDSNTATTSGGHVYNDGVSVTIDGGSITNGTASAGGGIYSQSSLSVANGSRISSNSATGATGGGGGIRITGGTFDIADAVMRSNQSTQTLGGAMFISGAQGSVTRSTIASSSAVNGAIALMSLTTTSTGIELTNSTLTGNFGFGTAGVWVSTHSTATIGNTTISGNTGGAAATTAPDAVVSLSSSTVTANGPSDAGIQNVAGSVSIDNSIVAGNFSATTSVDCGGSIVSNGYNLFGAGTGCPVGGTGDIAVKSADVFATVLGPLGDNGGPTQTHALLAGSPAIDRGNPAASGASTCTATDQRNLPRPQDGDGDGIARCDIGAFEAQASSGGGAGPATHFVLSGPAGATGGTAFTFTVAALDAGNSIATSYAGTIHFTSTDAGATLPADATLTSGAGSFSATLQTAGSQTITATDVASAITGTSSGITVTVPAAAPPSIAKAFGPASIEVGEVSTLTFTVSNPNATTALTGVAFADSFPAGVVVAGVPQANNTCGGTVTAVAAAASVSLTGASLPAGGNCHLLVDVTAVTTGAKNNVSGSVTSTNGGTGNTATATLTVTSSTTSTTLASDHNPSIVGQTVTLAATVAGFNPGGTVTFKDGATVLATAPLAGGTATLGVSSLTQGTHTISANYSGDANNLPSASTLSQVVNLPPAKAATTTTITSSGSPASVGQVVAFTATVAGSSPTGTVTFADGNKNLGTAALVNGVATFNIATLGKGAHQITASYGGDSANLASTSSKLKQQIK